MTDSRRPDADAESANALAGGPFGAAFAYLVDAAQRSILFWGVMRQRGNQYREHIAQVAPHVLSYAAERLRRVAGLFGVELAADAVASADARADKNR